MIFLLDQSALEFKTGLSILMEERGHQLVCWPDGDVCQERSGEEIVIHWQPGMRETLAVSFDGCTIAVSCEEKVLFFRGVMKILNGLEADGLDGNCEFKEKAYFRSAGAMLDCSRNGVLKPDKIKEYIRRMASLGLNSMMLYTEETYEVPGYPYFGAFRGRYTKEELKELDDYAQAFGIEIVPCIQTLAHLHTALRWKEMEGLSDTPDILMAGEEEVYRLIEAMIGTMSEAFRSRRIHLGMDEAHDLGLGKYLNKNGYQNRFAIMNSHLNRVLAICRKYGMEPMIWSDMYFRLKSPVGDYYDLPPEADFADLPDMPQAVSMVYWDYYHDNKEHYINYINLHKKLSDQTVFAGGAWIWNGIAPNYSWMKATLVPGLEACRESGVKDVVCTFWQDNGAETPMEAGNLALALFAEECFEEEDGKKADRALDYMKFLWGDDSKAWWLLDRFDCTPGIERNNSSADNPSKYLLYQDVLLGLFDGQIRGLGLTEHYKKLAEDLTAYRRCHPDSSLIFEYYEVLARLLEQKAELGIRVYDSYHVKDKAYLKEAGEIIIPSCIQLSKRLRELRRRLWMRECRVFGFEVLDIRLAGVTARLENAGRRILEYVSGEISALPELEEERVVYAPDTSNRDHALCSCNLWQNIISAGNMAGV